MLESGGGKQQTLLEAIFDKYNEINEYCAECYAAATTIVNTSTSSPTTTTTTTTKTTTTTVSGGPKVRNKPGRGGRVSNNRGSCVTHEHLDASSLTESLLSTSSSSPSTISSAASSAQNSPTTSPPTSTPPNNLVVASSSASTPPVERVSFYIPSAYSSSPRKTRTELNEAATTRRSGETTTTTTKNEVAVASSSSSSSSSPGEAASSADGSGSLSGSIKVSISLVMSGLGLSQIGNVQELANMCHHVLELDLSKNEFNDWNEIKQLFEALKKLRLLNLSSNKFNLKHHRRINTNEDENSSSQKQKQQQQQQRRKTTTNSSGSSDGEEEDDDDDEDVEEEEDNTSPERIEIDMDVVVPTTPDVDMDESSLSSSSSNSNKQQQQQQQKPEESSLTSVLEERNLFTEWPLNTHLTTLILNSCHLELDSVVERLVERMPNLAELHLASNDYERITFSPAFRSTSVKVLYFNNNQLRSWLDVCRLGVCFPALETLVISENHIDTFVCNNEKSGGNTEEEVDDPFVVFKHLSVLIANKLKINDWSSIDHLRKFPSLRHVRIQNIPLLESLNDDEKYFVLVGHLDETIHSLNGSLITSDDKENCERKYLRYFMDFEEKPRRYFELESKHGKLDKLADVNMEIRKKVNVRIKYNGKYVNDKIDVRQTVGDFKKYLETKYVGLPANRFKVFYIDIEAFSVYGPEELKHANRCLYSFNVRDHDEFEIDLKPTPQQLQQQQQTGPLNSSSSANSVLSYDHHNQLPYSHLHHLHFHHYNSHMNNNSQYQFVSSSSSQSRPISIAKPSNSNLKKQQTTGGENSQQSNKCCCASASKSRRTTLRSSATEPKSMTSKLGPTTTTTAKKSCASPFSNNNNNKTAASQSSPSNPPPASAAPPPQPQPPQPQQQASKT